MFLARRGHHVAEVEGEVKESIESIKSGEIMESKVQWASISEGF